MSESVFEIHDWTLRVDDNMLCRPDREVYLEPRLVNLLRFLACHTGTVFGRASLIKEVWDCAEVTDQVVTQSIFELRKILKDGRFDAADYIVTVPKRGYKLVASVRPLQVPRQDREVVRLAVEVGEVGGQRIDEVLPLALAAWRGGETLRLAQSAEELDAYLKEASPRFVHLTPDYLSRALIVRLDQRGVRGMVNVLGDPDRAAAADGRASYDAVINSGVSIIQTDRPKDLIERMTELGRHRTIR